MPSPTLVPIGHHTTLTQTRYKLTLSTDKQLILFRLPSLPSRSSRNTINGWTYYAMEAECPHAGGPMADAHVEVSDIEESSSYIASCPWHAYDFDLETGESRFGVKACVFPVVVGGDGEIGVEVEWEGAGLTLMGMEGVGEGVRFKHGPRDARRKRDEVGDLGEEATMVQWCVKILRMADPERKIELTTQLFSAFATREGSSSPMALGAGTMEPPDEPPREALQEVKPWEMPNPGRGGTLKSRILMLHALANIEQWAIDLAIDICVRFATFQTIPRLGKESQPLPRTFYHDWLKVANDEAKHFSLLRARLEDLGSHFGALPVHHGLWESATLTKDDLRARISVIALVHEARGLDINPMTIAKFRKAGDTESVETLTVIHNDEITHVTTGHRWLSWICEQEGRDPVEVFRENVVKFFKGAVKGPFNAEARLEAGMDGRYYENLGRGPARGHVIAGG